MIMGYDSGLRFWATILGYDSGLRFWAMIIGYDYGLRFWAMILGYDSGLRLLAMIKVELKPLTLTVQSEKTLSVNPFIETGFKPIRSSGRDVYCEGRVVFILDILNTILLFKL